MSRVLRILILEDDHDVSDSLQESLSSAGYLVTQAFSPAEARRDSGAEPPDLLLLDIAFPGSPRGGLEFLQELRIADPRLPVVVISGKDSKFNLLEAGRLGARQFLTKGEFGETELFDAVRQSMLEVLEEKTGEQKGVERLLGNARVMRKLRSLIKRYAPLDMPVLIQGSTGSGKELVAKALHEEAPLRAMRQLIVLNCAAIPESIMESHLFGHRKGAFTGAIHDYDGLIRQAEGSTLFLDEVGELSLAAQQRFLRFLESGHFQAVGDRKSSHVQTRVVTASHQDLAQLVEIGKFREDLWFRLNVLMLEVPLLRERPEDIQLLANTFLQSAARRNHLPHRQLSPSAMDSLLSHDWPGNVRELRNLMERLLVGIEDPVVEAREISLLLPKASSATGRWGAAHGAAGVPLDNTASAESVVPIPQSVAEIQPLRVWRHHQQRLYVQRALSLCMGNVTRTAELLEVDRSTIYTYVGER